ncbi:KAP family P-loop NTPase fold protein [Hymenobacter rubripertinctus]|uniref:KAP NTPase domain-containing protein n=1 Tax=Hymenobacter rubripertinctus TaxID=2029981 RepID=A0A418QJ65_9BACT|nr:P-loop NTPase fold protein [Hymenobacter rubripertinctus]RIY05227.1 hypothetical protein D0T11_20775 [Hymenobacter rubripertinctus]
MPPFDFSADKPVATQPDDYFQRYEFARRVARVLAERRDSTSITLGVYGAWGEGKTSVMNFIAQELAAQSDTIVVPFNPWRFSDEQSLLLAFFTTLADRLKPLSKANRWRFFSRKESLGKLISKYAQYTAVLKATPISGVADAASGLGKALSDVPLETLKERIEQLLRDSKRKIVIIIDDIDRLEKAEIHAVFRLVKLTADFPYTHYILCFDDQIVAAALGERFGEGNPQAGHDFLEKIIQIPLRLPQASRADLRDYLFELLNKALDSTNVAIPVDQLEEFRTRFNEHFLLRFTTPRLAKRYINSISFVLPLLEHEVNYQDLLLIEAVKLFYPALYELIRDHPRYFIGSFEAPRHSVQDEKARHTTFFEQHLQAYLPQEKAAVQAILADTFPKLRELWSNYSRLNDHEELFNTKSIGSSYYFHRYFSYAVTKGETSDIFYDALLTALGHNLTEAERLWRQVLDDGRFGDLYMRLYFRRNEFTSRQASTLIHLMAGCEEALLDKQRYTNNLFHRHFDATHLVANLLTFRLEEAEQIPVLEAVVANNVTFSFVYEVARELLRPGRIGEPVGPALQTRTESLLLARALADAAGKPLFNVYPAQTRFLLMLWVKQQDGVGSLATYLQTHVRDAQCLLELVRAFAPITHSSAQPEPYYCNFGAEQFIHMRELFVPYDFACFLPEAARTAAAVEEFPAVGYRDPASDDLLLAQFGYWCTHPLSKEAAEYLSTRQLPA